MSDHLAAVDRHLNEPAVRRYRETAATYAPQPRRPSDRATALATIAPAGITRDPVRIRFVAPPPPRMSLALRLALTVGAGVLGISALAAGALELLLTYRVIG